MPLKQLYFFISFLLFASFVNAQDYESQLFRNNPTGLEPEQAFNPTLRTSANKGTAIVDAIDSRIFPSAHDQATVHIDIDKQNPNHLIATCETIFSNSANIGYFYSNDGAATWAGQEQLQNAVSGGNWPRISTSANGNTYLSGVEPATNFSQKSIDGGVNWTAKFNSYININEQPVYQNICVDKEPTSPYQNNYYSVWNNNSGTPSLASAVFFQKSSNNGSTFSSPLYLKNGPGAGTNVQTGPNGEIYVCWANRTFGTPTASTGLGFTKSLDGGNTFSVYQSPLSYVGIRAGTTGVNPIFNSTIVNDYPSMAVDKSSGSHRGRIYVAVPIKENGSGKAVVSVSFSDDQGITWSSLQTISIPAGRQNWNPAITVDDCSGEVWVIYYSFDTLTGFATNTYVALSSDGGASWINQRVSDVSHMPSEINPAITLPGYAGYYNSITAYAGKAYPIWSDNRNGTWQLYCSPLNTYKAFWTQNGTTTSLNPCNQMIGIPPIPDCSDCGTEYSATGYATNPSASSITWSLVGKTSRFSFSTTGNSFSIYCTVGGLSFPTDEWIVIRCTTVTCGITEYKDYWFYTSTPHCTGVPGFEMKMNQEKLSIGISPNPSQGQFVIKLNTKATNSSIKEVIVTNKMGAVVYRQKFTGNQKLQKIRLENKPLDNYIVKVFDGKDWYSEKIIIVR